MLSEKDIEAYRRDGYLVVPNVYTRSEIEALHRATDDLVAAASAVTEHDDVYDLEPDHTPEVPRVRRIKFPNQCHSAYDDALRQPRMLDIVEQLIGPGVRFLTTKLNMKSADFGSQVEWHQDWAFYPHTNDDILAVGVAIDDMTRDNGCLLAVPGSHCQPLRSHHENGVFVGAVTDGVIDMETAVPVEVAAGGISIHHVRVLHASAPNRSPNSRRLLLLELAAIDAWPLAGCGDWETFKAKALRGEQGIEPRVEAVPVHMPEPKPTRQGSIYEIQTQMSRPQMKHV